MTGPDYDAEFEAFLKRRSSMHRRLSDSDHAEPSLETDRLVLNRAREAIETPEQPLYRSSRWALPIGLAAAILIAFTVVLNIDHHGTKPVASNASPAAEAAQQAPAPLMASTRGGATTQDAPTNRKAPANSPPTAATSAPAAPAPPPPPAAAAATDPHSSPDAWLREINRLRAAGRTADAERELAAFRTAYPSHPAYSVAKPPAR